MDLMWQVTDCWYLADSRLGVRRGDINGSSPNQHSPGQGSPVPSPSHPAHGQNDPPTEFNLNSTDLALASIPGNPNNYITMATHNKYMY